MSSLRRNFQRTESRRRASSFLDARTSTPTRSAPRSLSLHRRPHLLRASATEPSITTANEMKGSLAGPCSLHKATDLLSRVAVYTPTSPPHEHVEQSPLPHHPPVEAIFICHQEKDTSSPNGSPSSQSTDMTDSPGYYFSFPRIEEDLPDDKQEDIDKDSDD